MLSNLLVDTRIENPRLRAEMRFECLNAVVLVEFLQGVVGQWVHEIPEDAGLGRTNLNASRFQAFGDSVIAQSAFLGRLGNWAQEPTPVWASLDAESAPNAVFGIDQHCTIGSVKGRSYWTDLHARRVLAQVTELGDEEG